MVGQWSEDESSSYVLRILSNVANLVAEGGSRRTQEGLTRGAGEEGRREGRGSQA